MLNTTLYIFLLQLANGFDHQRFMAILELSHKLLSPQSFEVVLQLAEHKFDWIILWRIRQIIDPAEAMLSHSILSSITGVSAKIVHE